MILTFYAVIYLASVPISTTAATVKKQNPLHSVDKVYGFIEYKHDEKN